MVLYICTRKSPLECSTKLLFTPDKRLFSFPPISHFRIPDPLRRSANRSLQSDGVFQQASLQHFCALLISTAIISTFPVLSARDPSIHKFSLSRELLQYSISSIRTHLILQLTKQSDDSRCHIAFNVFTRSKLSLKILLH